MARYISLIIVILLIVLSPIACRKKDGDRSEEKAAKAPYSDIAKWSEAKSAMGTIATALRTYCSANMEDVPKPPSFEELGLGGRVLDGTYFKVSDYSIMSVNYIAATRTLTYTIQAVKSTFNPSIMVLTEKGWK